MITLQGTMELKVDSESLGRPCEFLLGEMVEWATEGGNERRKDTGVGRGGQSKHVRVEA